MRRVKVEENISLDVISQYPKIRMPLPEEFMKIYDEHYVNNRDGNTNASSISKKMEEWLHKTVAKSAIIKGNTLEIGGGTLNQLHYETSDLYDVVEPYEVLYKNRSEKSLVNKFYSDISEVPESNKYDRIITIACFEHILNLPEVVEKTTKLLKNDGGLYVSIPNEGRFLWHFAYTMTTGREFKHKYGLDYEILMKHEHVNTADEIEAILAYYFEDVQMKLRGVSKDLSFYRFYQCKKPKCR